MIINEVTNCETVIASDESVRLRLELSPVSGEDLQIDLNDSQCRILITYAVEHLYESKKDVFAECLHECLQNLALAAFDTLDEDEE